jgi:hypothetical protein
VVEAVFKLLVEPGPAGEVTSQRLPRARLRSIEAAGDRVERVVERLLADGLLRRTPGASEDDEHVEVTHEALIRNWPRLVDWVTDERQRQRRRLQLAADAEAWEAHGRDKSGLLSGVRLAEAQEYADRSPLEDELVAESLDAVRDTKRRLWQGIAAVLGLGVVLLGALLWQSIRASSNAAAVAEERQERERQQAIAVAESRRAEAEYERAKSLSAVWQLFAARPAIQLAGGAFTPPAGWESLGERRGDVARVAAAVGAVRGGGSRSLSTGFLVAPGVLLAFAAPGLEGLDAFDVPRWVDFADAPGVGEPGLAEGSGRDWPAKPSPLRFAVEKELGTLYTGEVMGGGLTLLRLAGTSTAGEPLPPPLRLAAHPRGEQGTALYAVGYPMRDPRTPAEVLDYMLAERAGVKRLQPGYLLSVDHARGVFQHDCFTLPGNAGSPVVELATGRVMGVHLGGQLASAEGPGVKEAAALWLHAGDPLLRRSGARFE